MSRKLPPSAFEYYFGLGPGRSYVAVAKQFGIHKSTVVAGAKSQQWQERLKEKERKAAETLAKKTEESIEAMRERHLRLLKAVQGRAAQALQSIPLETAAAAVKALLASLSQERLLRDDGAAAGADDVEAIVRREYALFLRKPGTKDDWDD